ncbi:MAG TPA: DUF2378 family protein [Polyangiaceae bacterium]|nr:DUF2378 family protein [Polyangiaceae bacterium]
MSAGNAFIEPPWSRPLDPMTVLHAVPASSTIAGMFFLAALEGAKRRGLTLSPARERYLRFGFYPLGEFVPLLVEAARKFYPDRSLREALRAVGQAGPAAFSASVLGKVTLGAAEGVHAAVGAIASTYAINVPGSRCDVLESSPRRTIVGLRDVHHFLDSHHVGVFEGTLQYAGVKGSVRIASHGATSADLLLEWG